MTMNIIFGDNILVTGLHDWLCKTTADFSGLSGLSGLLGAMDFDVF